MLKIKYTSSVKTMAGWRSVTVVADAEQVSEGMAQVVKVETIDGDTPAYGQSRTGSKRQQYNGLYWAREQVGARKRLSACEVIA